LAAQCERRIALEDGRVREREPLPITEPVLA
jgi:hypothetical protein